VDKGELARIRLHSQGLVGPRSADPRKIIARMGAIQAQDFEMAKWAIGLRLADPHMAAVQGALDRGEILRTHLLRPTWHLVAAEDIRWLLELTGPRIKAALASRLRELEITPAILAKSFDAIGKALAGGSQLRRKELIAILGKAGVKTDGQRASHILLAAEIEALICSGAGREREGSYVLLDARAPRAAGLEREEAMARLALRYFESRGPARVEDFSWWSGLSLGDARRAAAAIESELEAIELDQSGYLAARSSPSRPGGAESVFLLPAYDEFLISYADRSAAIGPGGRERAISSNGIFWPTIALGGTIVGTWARARGKEGSYVEYEPFKRLDRKARDAIEARAGEYLSFLG
jgi:hypothetical protein